MTLRKKDPQERTLGIEGGGTKTEWVFVKNQTNGAAVVVKNGQLGPANLRLISDAALRRLFHLLPRGADRIGAFLAGCVTESDRKRLYNIAHSVWPSAQIVVGSDRESGFAAAFRNSDGITVTSGTGAAVTGRKAGKIEHAGGRGHLLGDRGGGYVIAIEGLRLALRSYDLQHRVSPLAENILRALSLNRIEDLIAWTQGAEKKDVSALVPVLFECAEEGDKEMLQIIHSSASTLAQYTESVARWLKLENPTIKLMGSLFVHESLYVSLYRKALKPLLRATAIEVCKESGAIGAAFLAAMKDNEPVRMELSKAATQEIADSRTEKANPRSKGIDRFPLPRLIRLFIAEEKEVQRALEGAAESLESAVRILFARMRRGGRLFYIGAGTSGRLGILDASEIPPTFGESTSRVQAIIAGGQAAITNSVEGAEDDELQAVQSIRERGVRKGDVVCGISASGRTPFVLAALREAEAIGANAILITCNPDAESVVSFETAIVLTTGPEVIAGSTRLKCGTATKAALNILSTCTMIKLGKVRGNQMVDMQAVNTKLKNRAVRIVSELQNWPAERAEKQLRKHGWNIRRVLSKH